MIARILNVFRRPEVRLTKSEIADRLAKSRGFKVVDVKMSDSDPLDMLGMPIVEYSAHDIEAGDQAMMEYAKDMIIPVDVSLVEAGIVYGTGFDGDHYCAPIQSCVRI